MSTAAVVSIVRGRRDDAATADAAAAAAAADPPKKETRPSNKYAHTSVQPSGAGGSNIDLLAERHAHRIGGGHTHLIAHQRPPPSSATAASPAAPASNPAPSSYLLFAIKRMLYGTQEKPRVSALHIAQFVAALEAAFAVSSRLGSASSSEEFPARLRHRLDAERKRSRLQLGVLNLDGVNLSEEQCLCLVKVLRRFPIFKELHLCGSKVTPAVGHAFLGMLAEQVRECHVRDTAATKTAHVARKLKAIHAFTHYSCQDPAARSKLKQQAVKKLLTEKKVRGGGEEGGGGVETKERGGEVGGKLRLGAEDGDIVDAFAHVSDSKDGDGNGAGDDGNRDKGESLRNNPVWLLQNLVVPVTIDTEKKQSLAVKRAAVADKGMGDSFTHKGGGAVKGSVRKLFGGFAHREKIGIPTEMKKQVDDVSTMCYVENCVLEGARVFVDLDTDRNGAIDRAEMSTGLKEMCLELSETDIDKVFSLMDKNNSGFISRFEFLDVVARRSRNTVRVKHIQVELHKIIPKNNMTLNPNSHSMQVSVTKMKMKVERGEGAERERRGSGEGAEREQRGSGGSTCGCRCLSTMDRRLLESNNHAPSTPQQPLLRPISLALGHRDGRVPLLRHTDHPVRGRVHRGR